MGLKTYGTMAVDWEERINFDRLRKERLGARQGASREVGDGGAALLRHEQRPLHLGHAHRHVGAGQDQPLHAALARAPNPSSGTSARPRVITPQNCSWLGERSRAGIPLMRGAMSPEMGRAEDVAKKIKVELEKLNLHKRTARRGRRRAGGAVRAPEGRPEDRRRPGADVERPRHQDAGRDLAAQPLGRDGRRRVPRSLQGDEARHARERSRRPRRQAALRSRLGVRRGRERDFRRTLQPAPARVLGPHAAARRSGVLRHPALLHGLSHVLLPHVRDRLGVARAQRRLQALPRLPRCGHRAGPAGTHDGRDRRRSGRRRRSSGSRTKKPRSRCRWATASDSPSGRSR